MSISSLLSSTTGDDDDEFPATDSTGSTPVPPSERTSDALARFMLDAVLTGGLRRLLKSSPRLILIRTADQRRLVCWMVTSAVLIGRRRSSLYRTPKDRCPARTPGPRRVERA